MLDRSRRDRLREQRRRWQADYRKRFDAGRVSITFDVGGSEVAMLVRTKWLPAAESHTRKEIAEAVQAMLKDAAK